MILNTSSVDLEGITSSVPRSQFDENELEYLANLFLKSGDTVRPILLHEKSPIAFEVLEGHREYYAALKAQEVDPRFEAIRAYIVPSDRQDSILEQYRFFHDSNNANNGKSTDSNSREQNVSVADIKRIIADEINPLKSSLRDISAKIDQKVTTTPLAPHQNLSDQFLFSMANLEAMVEKIVESVLAKHLQTTKSTNPKPAKSSVKNGQEREQEFVNELNICDLSRIVDKFSQVGYKSAESYAEEIFNSRKIKPYASFEDIKSRKNAKGKPVLSPTALEKLFKIWWSP